MHVIKRIEPDLKVRTQVEQAYQNWKKNLLHLIK